MNALSNFNRKLVYEMIIVAIFGVMFPYTGWLAAEKKRRDLGEAAIGQIDTGSFMMKLFLLGGFRGIVAWSVWGGAVGGNSTWSAPISPPGRRGKTRTRACGASTHHVRARVPA